MCEHLPAKLALFMQIDPSGLEFASKCENSSKKQCLLWRRWSVLSAGGKTKKSLGCSSKFRYCFLKVKLDEHFVLKIKQKRFNQVQSEFILSSENNYCLMLFTELHRLVWLTGSLNIFLNSLFLLYFLVSKIAF